MVQHLKSSNVSQWYKNIKRMYEDNKNPESETQIKELKGLSPQKQCEQIADHFAKISQLYTDLRPEHISFESAPQKQITPIEPWDVHRMISESKSGSSTVKGDVPIKIVKEFGLFLAEPISNIWKRCISHGEYPKRWKIENVTPVPKSYPPKSLKDLRKISGTLNCSKLFEKYLSTMIVEDMKHTADKAQLGGKKKLSIQHLLVKLVDRILTALDKK